MRHGHVFLGVGIGLVAASCGTTREEPVLSQLQAKGAVRIADTRYQVHSTRAVTHPKGVGDLAAACQGGARLLYTHELQRLVDAKFFRNNHGFPLTVWSPEASGGMFIFSPAQGTKRRVERRRRRYRGSFPVLCVQTEQVDDDQDGAAGGGGPRPQGLICRVGTAKTEQWIVGRKYLVQGYRCGQGATRKAAIRAGIEGVPPFHHRGATFASPPCDGTKGLTYRRGNTTVYETCTPLRNPVCRAAGRWSLEACRAHAAVKR